MKAQGEEEVAKLREEKDKAFEEMKASLDEKVAETTKMLEGEQEKVRKMVEKIQSNKGKIDELEETIQANKIDLEANTLEIEMLKEEKQELLAEMTETSKVAEDDILNSLSSDELK